MTNSPVGPIDDLRFHSERHLAIWAFALLLIPSVWYLRTDLALYAGDWLHLRERLIVRGLLVGLCIAGMLLVGAAKTRLAHSRIVLGLSLGVAVALLAINALRPGGAALPLRSPLLTLAVMYAALPNRFRLQILPPLLLTAGLIVLRLTWTTAQGDADAAGDILILLLLNALGILITARRVALDADLDRAWRVQGEEAISGERALAPQTRLPAFVVICIHCQNVRAADGTWEPIEALIHRHAGSTFSHGLCSECHRKHYPDL